MSQKRTNMQYSHIVYLNKNTGIFTVAENNSENLKISSIMCGRGFIDYQYFENIVEPCDIRYGVLFAMLNQANVRRNEEYGNYYLVRVEYPNHVADYVHIPTGFNEETKRYIYEDDTDTEQLIKQSGIILM